MDKGHWKSLAESHWREHRPKLVAELEAKQELDAALDRAVERTAAEYDPLIEAGFEPHEAWEAVRQNHLLLPQEPGLEDEEENPHLDRMGDLGRIPQEVQDAMTPPEDRETTPSPTPTS